MLDYTNLLKKKMPYSVPDNPWEEELGNHRAVLKVSADTGKCNAVVAVIPWRRRDFNPGKKRIIVQNAATGERAKHVLRFDISPDAGAFAFSPVEGAKEYHVYYMPYRTQEGHGFYNKGYYGPEPKPPIFWALKIRKAARALVMSITKNHDGNSVTDRGIATTEVVEIQSRTRFDSFFPMEVPATEIETKELTERFRQPFLLFPEDRKYPIRMADAIPTRWVEIGSTGRFEGSAQPNEYYAMQIGIFAGVRSVNNIGLRYSGLGFKNGGYHILADAFTCFNLEGTDINGSDFVKSVDVEKGALQALWIGLDVPEDAPEGCYTGSITVSADGCPEQTVDLTLNISGPALADRGDGEPWRHSRLRWLNSTMGNDPAVFAPFSPIRVDERTISYGDRIVTLGPDGLPIQVACGNVELLKDAIELDIHHDGDPPRESNFAFTRNEDGRVEWRAASQHGSFERTLSATTEPDGFISFSVTVTARSACEIQDVALRIPVSRKHGRFFMGMEKSGGYLEAYRWDWKGPSNSFWVGDHVAGLHVKLLGASYSGPLLNLYHPEPPPSWYNGGKGRFEITLDSPDTALLSVGTGSVSMAEGDSLDFEFACIVTPIKKLDPSRHFSTRYYHHIDPGDREKEAGVNLVNAHHANRVNPFINYPFIATEEMKRFVREMHGKDIAAKIYYTVREMTYLITELWAFRSLGDEIFATERKNQWGRAWRKAYPWLQEHLRDNFVPQWYTVLEDGTVDVAILTSGESRFYNYYIEGLAWLVENIDIDGLYLDDVSFDRRIVRRIRYVLESKKPGACLVDLHSNTGFSKGPAVKYTDFFAFVDKLWFGESFRYDAMPPDQWLVECSGIPFGLMGDMLQDGGNRWRGMLFGMTNRPPQPSERSPYPIWRVWDEFGIADARMIGFWEDGCPIRSSNPLVPVTVYVRDDRALVAVASWAATPVRISFEIDWEALGLSPERAIFRGREIENFQQAVELTIDGSVTVDPKRGYLLYLERQS